MNLTNHELIINFNRIWTRIFANLGKGGGGNHHSNLAISNKTTMKHGRDLLRIQIDKNFDDIISISI